MQTIELSQVVVLPNRQRKEGKDSRDLAELKKGILTKGLNHAPGLALREEKWTLVFGERRLLAITELHQDGLEFRYNNEPVPHNHLPYVDVGNLSEDNLEEAELEENVLRSNLTWPEETQAKVKILALRKKQNPDITTSAVAEEIVRIQNPEGSIDTERVKLVKMQTVAAHLHNPNVKSQRTLDKAYNVILDQRKAELESQLLRLSPTNSAHKVIHGDCKIEMRKLEKSSFDLILSDPPYGIDADKMKKEAMHNYDDSPDTALGLYQDILRVGFHLLKPQGIFFLFCDIEHFISIRTFAEQQALSTWRTPIIWHKGNEGHAPWGKNGFTRTYETILFAVKGQRPLVLNGGPDVRLIKRDTVGTKLHGAEKPPELLRWLLQIATRKGDRVLDPCCGSGPIFPAASGLNLSITGIELNEQYYNTSCSRLLQAEATPESVVAHKATLSDIERSLGLPV